MMTSKYCNGKIYKIIDKSSDMIYVGSTIRTLNQRLGMHISQFKSFKAHKAKFMTSFKILENDNYKIELISLYPCENKKELEFEEGKHILKLKNDGFNVVNKCIVGQTRKESKSRYYKNHKTHINELQKKKHKCICGSQCSISHKSCHEKTRKHQDYIDNCKTIINHGTININITVNNLDEIDQLEQDFLNALK